MSRIIKTALGDLELYEQGEKTPLFHKLDPSETWSLMCGIHAGTFTSRDFSNVPALSSFVEAQTRLVELAHSYAKMGYFIWYAYAVAPDGTQHRLCPDRGYR